MRRMSAGDGLGCGWCYQKAAVPPQLKKTSLVGPRVESKVEKFDTCPDE